MPETPYLELSIDDRGEVEDIAVERPRPEERGRFEALLGDALEGLARHAPTHAAGVLTLTDVIRYSSNIGISKIARVVDVFAKRLQVQEKLTAQIAQAGDDIVSAAPRLWSGVSIAADR